MPRGHGLLLSLPRLERWLWPKGQPRDGPGWTWSSGPCSSLGLQDGDVRPSSWSFREKSTMAVLSMWMACSWEGRGQLPLLLAPSRPLSKEEPQPGRQGARLYGPCRASSTHPHQDTQAVDREGPLSREPSHLKWLGVGKRAG